MKALHLHVYFPVFSQYFLAVLPGSVEYFIPNSFLLLEWNSCAENIANCDLFLLFLASPICFHLGYLLVMIFGLSMLH